MNWGCDQPRPHYPRLVQHSGPHYLQRASLSPDNEASKGDNEALAGQGSDFNEVSQ